jgi:hypothetical protein
VNARLDKTGSRVLCVRTDCGTELARVTVHAGERRVVFGRGWRATIGEGELPLWVHRRARREPRRSTNPANRTSQGEVVTVARVLPAWVRCICGLTQRLEAGPLRVPDLAAEEPGLWTPATDVTDPYLIRIPEAFRRSGSPRDSGVSTLMPSE